MKKKTAAISALIAAIIAVLPLVNANAAAFFTNVRIRLSSGYPSSMELTVNGDYYIEADPSFEISSGKVKIEKQGSRAVLTYQDRQASAAVITLINRDYGKTDSSITLKNDSYGPTTYLGNMSFDIKEGGIRVINTLPIEQYLYGVVPYEMSNTFPLEALKAQAVCARGYVAAACSQHSGRSYDVTDTSNDQVYHGYVAEYTRAKRAVDETKGQVLTYEGEIIQAYYAASNGGQTELTGNVWDTDLPYYVHRDDEYDLKNPSSMEEKSFIPDTFTPESTALMDKTVLNILESGAESAAGEPCELISTVAVVPHSPIYPEPCRLYTKADITLVVKTASAEGQVTFTLNYDDIVRSDENPEGIFNTHGATLRMRGAERGIMKANGNEYRGWYLTNRRYGHGVGLSQRSAQQRAVEGQEYASMLGFYYVGTELSTVGEYSEAPELSSGVYRVSQKGITGIKPDTPVESVLSAMKSDGQLAAVNRNGALKTEGKACSGDFIRIVYNSGTYFTDVPLIVFGDTDGDGEITSADADAVNQHILGTQRLFGARLAAADADGSGGIDISDVLMILRAADKEAEIDQERDAA